LKQYQYAGFYNANLTYLGVLSAISDVVVMDHRGLALTRNLAADDIFDALEVSKKVLGSDYLGEEDFLETFNSASVFCKTATYNGQFAGFAICQIFGPDKIDEVLHLPVSSERGMFLSKERFGLFDSVAVRKDHQGLGIGTELSDACLREFMLRGVDIICAMAWKSVDGTVNIEGILRRMGMSSSLEIPGYWNQMVDSPGGHDCPVCGRPCRCSAVLYYKDVK